jgi:hypothetical protein
MTLRINFISLNNINRLVITKSNSFCEIINGELTNLALTA